MTTIAWDGRTLAADTATASTKGVKSRYARKLRRFKDGRIAGAAGTLTQCIQMLDWLESGKPKPPKFKYPDVEVLVIHPDGKVVEYDEDGVPMPVDEPVAAIGSGEKIALGALLAGATAIKAVEIAISRDKDSGFDVAFLNLKAET